MSIFQNFTNQYSLSKTLRFELKPVGETLKNMKEHLEYDKDLQTFLKDQDIENAYQVLKPILDNIHEDFITQSLESEEVKEIDFSEYLEKYKEKVEDKGEKKLREEIGKLYEVGEKKIKSKYRFLNLKWKKGSSEAKGALIMETQDMLEVIRQESLEDEKIQNALNIFKGFFTYFSGFNQNRGNYYFTNDQKGKGKQNTIAYRIVDENLPKFCDNILQFEAITKKKKDGTMEKTERKEEYKNTYQYLKDKNKTTQIKDAESGKMIELSPIAEEIFDVSYFVNCLSQKQIEEYNRKIGHYNSLINLYNQVKRSEEKDVSKDKKTFRDLPKFKTLYKQIGCGEKKALFFALTHNTKKEAEENKENHVNPYSVEQILELAYEAGKKYFQKNEEEDKITLQKFCNIILEREDYNGMYWSKSAMNTISNKYFANFHDLKDRLKKTKVFKNAKNESEEELKISEAIELSQLFTVLDETEDWKITLFKKSILEDKAKQEIIERSESASEALLKMIIFDMEMNAKIFLDEAKNILTLAEYKMEESKAKIKEWMDLALGINQMLKYFLVKEGKIKKGGNPIDSEITEMLNVLVFAEDAQWFKWYEALRNYLTKKPQDSAKENKLKLNFDCSYLLRGYDKEYSTYGSLIFEKDKKQYLLLLKKGGLTESEITILDSNINSENFARRLVLETQKIDNKNPPRWFIRSKKDTFSPLVREGKIHLTNEILNIYDNDLFSATTNKKNIKNICQN